MSCALCSALLSAGGRAQVGRRLEPHGSESCHVSLGVLTKQQRVVVSSDSSVICSAGTTRSSTSGRIIWLG